MQVIKELYVLPDDGQYLLYAPLKRAILRVNRSVLELICQIRNGAEVRETGPLADAIAMLRSVGILDAEEHYPPRFRVGPVYRPTNVTFLPTSDCNLRCAYCYADSGVKVVYLDAHAAKAAVDFVFANAVARTEKRVQVGFLGGGEPFLAWDLVQDIVAWSRSRASETGIEVFFTGVTNGVLPEQHVHWLVDNFRYLNVSIDGPEATHDRHRPMKGGRGSFSSVLRTVRILNGRGFKFAIRSTVSSLSVQEMVPTVEYFCDELRATQIQLEPLFSCGRCRTHRDLAPEPAIFADNFKKCVPIALSAGAELLCSAVRLDVLTSTFCGAMGENFYVTPEGYVTACTEVSSSDEALSEQFFIGKYDQGRQEYVLWDEKRNMLSSRVVDNLPDCQQCIAKWHCAGGCPSKAAYHGDMYHTLQLPSCEIARALTEDSVRRMSRGESDLKRIHVRSIRERSSTSSNKENMR